MTGVFPAMHWFAPGPTKVCHEHELASVETQTWFDDEGSSGTAPYAHWPEPVPSSQAPCDPDVAAGKSAGKIVPDGHCVHTCWL
jgi:hypothetical protein